MPMQGTIEVCVAEREEVVITRTVTLPTIIDKPELGRSHHVSS